MFALPRAKTQEKCWRLELSQVSDLYLPHHKNFLFLMLHSVYLICSIRQGLYNQNVGIGSYHSHFVLIMKFSMYIGVNSWILLVMWSANVVWSQTKTKIPRNILGIGIVQSETIVFLSPQPTLSSLPTMFFSFISWMCFFLQMWFLQLH